MRVPECPVLRGAYITVGYFWLTFEREAVLCSLCCVRLSVQCSAVQLDLL